MPEILLHYIWQKQLWAGFAQYTTQGLPIEIISVGQHNQHAGPDFSNAHIRINGQDWVGNVEIHVRASDWYKHHHNTNPTYDTTILHVVAQADQEIENSRGEKIVQCELQYPHDKDYLSQLLAPAQGMDRPINMIDCSHQLISDPDLISMGWKQALLLKRLECKRQSIQQLLEITQQSWAHAFYISLAHNFGFHTNGLPFEALALATPLSYLQKHRNSLFQLTSILLGQSGLLEEQATKDAELSALWNEYCFLQKKFSLRPIDKHMWKRLRMRPQNTPEVRIRQFAHILYQSEHLFSQLMEAQTLTEMVERLTLKYGIDSIYSHVARPMPLGRKSIEILLINTVIPYHYAYAYAQQNTTKMNQAIALLEQVPKEDNTIIRQWAVLGQHIASAADTQALLHLYQNYCQPHRCFNCHVGQQVFAHKQLELF